MLEMQFFAPVRDALMEHYGAARVQLVKPVPAKEVPIGSTRPMRITVDETADERRSPWFRLFHPRER